MAGRKTDLTLNGHFCKGGISMPPHHPAQHGNNLQHTTFRQHLRPRQALPAVRASQTKQSLPSDKPRQTKKTSAPQPPSFVSQPVTVNVQQPDSKIERAAQPWWSTWYSFHKHAHMSCTELLVLPMEGTHIVLCRCGVSNGVWSGQVAAFSPATGERRPSQRVLRHAICLHQINESASHILWQRLDHDP